MTLQTLFKKSFSLTCSILLQTPFGKQLFFSSRNDLDLHKNADSAQKCEKILLAFYVTAKPSKGNVYQFLRDSVFEVIIFTFAFFVPLRQWFPTFLMACTPKLL